MSCIVCGDINFELHHVKTKKSGGSDEPHNLMPLCRREHILVHGKGMVWFSNRYPRAKKWLEENGWIVDKVKKKWTRYG